MTRLLAPEGALRHRGVPYPCSMGSPRLLLGLSRARTSFRSTLTDPRLSRTDRMKTVSRLVRQHAGQIVALWPLEALAAALAVLGPIPLQIAVDVVVEDKPLPGWLAPLRAVEGSGLLGMLAV